MKDEPSFFELDKFRLDEEWVEQVRLYHRYAVKLAKSRAEFERAKTNRELVEAEIGKEVRTDPQSFGLDKLTENGLREAIVRSDKYQEASKECIDKREEMEVLEAAVKTLDNRKYALQDLVQLDTRDYFAKPKSPKEANDRLANAERRDAFRVHTKKRK